MLPLPHMSSRVWRAKVDGRALSTAIRGAFSSGFVGTIAAAAMLVLLPATRMGNEAEVRRAAVAAPEAAILVATVPVPWLFAVTDAGGPAHEYARRSVLTGSTDGLVHPAIITVEDAWSSAFFGDRSRLSEFIEHVAVVNGLPTEFLLRLMRQESGLNYQAVSRAGAQGIAQFMPDTAGARGLADPFNPYEAIPKSAELLKEYRARFGNLGFAAAAYNAGPQRVRNWLSGHATLPKETREYVAKITDRTVEEWKQGGDVYASIGSRLDLQPDSTP